MILIDAPAAALAWLGRQGTRAVAASIFCGLAVPPLAALFKPFVAEAIFVLLTLAFLRVEPAALRAEFRRPGLLIAALAWTMLVVPALMALGLRLAGLPQSAPDLHLAMMLQAAAPPVMSAPAFAALMGLSPAPVLALLIVATALTPLTAPVFAGLVIGPSLTLAPLALGLRLAAILAGSALLAAAIRRLAGPRWVTAQRERIDGANVVVLFVFAVALMDGVAARMLDQPLTVLGYTALAFALVLAVLAATAAVFAPIAGGDAFAFGIAAAMRNMGLMLAATGAGVPDLTWLYFALAQFPVYLLPQILKPLARRRGPGA